MERAAPAPSSHIRSKIIVTRTLVIPPHTSHLFPDQQNRLEIEAELIISLSCLQWLGASQNYFRFYLEEQKKYFANLQKLCGLFMFCIFAKFPDGCYRAPVFCSHRGAEEGLRVFIGVLTTTIYGDSIYQYLQGSPAANHSKLVPSYWRIMSHYWGLNDSHYQDLQRNIVQSNSIEIRIGDLMRPAKDLIPSSISAVLIVTFLIITIIQSLSIEIFLMDQFLMNDLDRLRHLLLFKNYYIENNKKTKIIWK